MVEGSNSDCTYDILMSNRWLIEIALVAFMLCCKVICSGVFEVSVLKLDNNRGVTHNGRCCSGSSTFPLCQDGCRTFFSFCLNHYVQSLPKKRSCTFGSFVTQVLGANNIYTDDNDNDEGITIQLPFQFSWPGKFTLVAEAWHDIDGQGTIYDSSQLILQAFISDTIYPSMTWLGDTTISPTTEMRVKYRIRCKKNYYGTGCDVLCIPRDDHFGHFTCSENGTKVCDPNWTGQFCDQPRCSPECLANNGVCERPYECSNCKRTSRIMANTYLCTEHKYHLDHGQRYKLEGPMLGCRRCRLGWLGKHCEKCLPKNGCLHGICHQPYQCICRPGWDGPLCDVDLQYCSKKQPCLNAGTCVPDIGGNYTCLCSPGFGGENCQHPLCYEEYCQNGGLCRTRHGFRECLCKEDFYGGRCQHIKVDCSEITCHNGGRCYEGKHGGKCACADGYYGKRCERKRSPCDKNKCENGAHCRESESSPTGYTCMCTTGYGGTFCAVKIDPCSGVSCYHGGSCVFAEGYTKPTCECLEEYSGDFCQITSDPCTGVVCHNAGTCKASPMYDGFICYCAVGYYGEFCESEMNPCESSPCQNGGLCKNYISSFLCICKDNFAGKYCERFKKIPVKIEPKQRDDAREELTTSDAGSDEIITDETNGSNKRTTFSSVTLIVYFFYHLLVKLA